MTQIARDQFRMKDDPSMHIFHEDGRMFINRAEPAEYDAILMDAFGSLFTVPTHLTTLEAVTQFHQILAEDGVIIFNLGSAISGEGSRFLQAELATYERIFPTVKVYKVNRDYPDTRMQNLIIVASKKNLSVPDENADAVLADLLNHAYPVTSGRGSVLTDDLAPVEHFNAIAQNLYLKER